MKSNIDIVFTGGHAGTTALSVVDEIKKRNLPWKLSWIGSKQAIEGKNITTLEAKIFPSKEITFYSLLTGRLQRRFTLWTIPSLFKIPLGFFHALYLLLKIKPKVVISFGGFAAFPVVVVSFLLRIPVVIHEQTAAIGRSNKYSVFFAKVILLSREESRRYVGGKKRVEVIGNPTKSDYFQINSKAGLSSPPELLIIGGSRGSVQINRLVKPIIKKLLEKYHVVHQVGPVEYKSFLKIKDQLAENDQKRYEVHSFVEPAEMVNMFKKADLIVSRAGANTVSEIIAARKNALLIPIPWSYLEEQKKNAEMAKKLGLVEVLDQNQIMPDLLLKNINLRMENPEVGKKLMDIKSPDLKAAEKFVDIIQKELR